MYSKVIVPLDGTETAKAVLPFIEGIAGPLDLEVLLLRVVMPGSEELRRTAKEHLADLLPTLRREALDSLRSVEDRLTTKGIRVATDVRIGDPAAEILAECDRTGADLIAMATHGRSGLGRLVFGSVAETVIRNARVPVFVLRTPSGAMLRDGDVAVTRTR
jgi:nucleotide-binding universal stress UspA family protein